MRRIVWVLVFVLLMQSCTTNYSYRNKEPFLPNRFDDKIIKYNEPFYYQAPKFGVNFLFGNAIILGGGYTLANKIKENETNIGLKKDSINDNYNRNLIYTGLLGLAFNYLCISAYTSKTPNDKDILYSQVNDWAANRLNSNELVIGYTGDYINEDGISKTKVIKSIVCCSDDDLNSMYCKNLSELIEFSKLNEGPHFKYFFDKLVANSYNHIPKDKHYDVYKYYYSKYPIYLTNRINYSFDSPNDMFVYAGELNISNQNNAKEIRYQVEEKLYNAILIEGKDREEQIKLIERFNKVFENSDNPNINIYRNNFTSIINDIANEREKEILKQRKQDTANYKQLYEQGLSEMKVNKFGYAIESFNKAGKILNNIPDLYLNIADCFYNRQSYEYAITNYNYVLDLNPSDSVAKQRKEMAISEKAKADAIEQERQRVENIKLAKERAERDKQQAIERTKREKAEAIEKAIALKKYNSPEAKKERERLAVIQAEQERQRTIENNRQLAEERNRKYNFLCQGCSKLVILNYEPVGRKGCFANDGGNHNWINLGQVGEYNFSCHGCGIDVMLNSEPWRYGYGCSGNNGNSHSWYRN